MTLKPRNLILGIALLATLGASFLEWPAEDAALGKKSAATQPNVVPTERAAPTARGVEGKEPAKPTSLLLRPRFEAAKADLFAGQSWAPPPPPTAKIPPPVAPALPFRYLGKVMEAGQVLVFVSEGARTHLLRKGDNLPGYTVADVTAVDMSFVYLPLNATQRLTFGSAN